MSKSEMMASTGLTPCEYDPYADFAAEYGGAYISLLKFTKGEWAVDGEDVEMGTQYIADVPGLEHGYVRFETGQKPVHHLGLIRNGYRLPPREVYGELDESEWEVDKQGNPKDPYQPQFYLPLVNVRTGDTLHFVTSSDGGQRALAALSKAYSPKRHTSELPIISLGVGSYDHDDWGRVLFPVLTVVAWHDCGIIHTLPSAPPSAALPSPTTSKPAANAYAEATGKSVKTGADMDDDIPFGPEFR
jgi:hypothetical protein